MLIRKNISEAVIESALEQIPKQEYLDTLAGILSIKQRQLAKLPAYEQKAKLLRFAYGKGFETDYINQWLDSLRNC